MQVPSEKTSNELVGKGNDIANGVEGEGNAEKMTELRTEGNGVKSHLNILRGRFQIPS